MPKHSVKTVWLKNLKSDEQEAIKHSLLTNTAFINKLLEILKDLRQEEEKYLESTTDYSSAAWPYLRANRDGAMRAYRSVENLLETTET